MSFSGPDIYKRIVERDIEQKLKQGVNSMGRGKQHITEELEEQILENLKEKGKGTVKEISTNIGQGYHATYQRLTEMVRRGEISVYRDGKLNVYILPGETPDKMSPPKELLEPMPEPEKRECVTLDMVLPTPEEAVKPMPHGMIYAEDVMNAKYSNYDTWWTTLKNRLIKNGEIKALQVMVQIEEGD